jgi:glycosyltransferase involved in cell wall biosynthesis
VWIDLGRCLNGEPFRAAEVQACFQEARRLGGDPTATLLLADSLIDQGRLHEALAWLPDDGAAAGAADTRSVDRLEMRGEVLRELGRIEDAIDAHRRVVADASDRPIARLGLAECLAARGDVAGAAAQADWLVAHYPGVASTWIATALAHLAADRLLSAIAALRTALDVDPNAQAAKYNLAIAYARLGSRDLASETLRRIRDPRDVAMRWLPDAAARLVTTARDDLTPLDPGGVVSFIPSLDGGAGRVTVDIVRCLPGRSHAVVTIDDGDSSGMGLREELAALQVPVVRCSYRQVAALVRRLRPAIVIEHSRMPDDGAPPPPGRPRVISVSHGHLPFVESDRDWYVCLSHAERRRYAYVPDERVAVIPNGVDVARFARAPADWRYWRSRGDGTVRIAMLTRLSFSKCVRRLLHYLTPLAGLDVEITIAGRGERRWEIEPELASSAIGSHVRFVGPIRSEAVPGFLAAADIGLHLTEIDEETFCLSVHEMLAAGLPVVSQPRGSLPELVEDGVSGFLAESEEDIGGRLRFLAESRDLRARFGAAGRARAALHDRAIFERRWQELVTRCEARPREMPAPAPLPAHGIRTSRFVDRIRAAPRDRPVAFFIGGARQTGGRRLCDALRRTGAAGAPAADIAPWRHHLRGRSWRFRTLDDYLETRWTVAASWRGVYGCRLEFDDVIYLASTQDTPDWPERWLERVAGARWIALHRAEAPSPSWAAFYRDCGIQPIDVAYDDLVADSDVVAARLVRALGLD